MWFLSFLALAGIVAGQNEMDMQKLMEMKKAAMAAPVNSRDVCQRDPPHTNASPTPGDNGFRIKVSGRSQSDKYTPGQVYTVSINGTYPNQRLLGFMLVTVPENAHDETTAMGTFQHFNHGLTKFEDRCPHVVTHTYEHPKSGVEVLWTAPPAGTGCVEFRATVVEYKDIWYKDDGALTKIFCEDTGTTDSNRPQEMIPDCCACGTAKYQMTFHGLWSRQTHPTEFPSHKRLLHWSNIVGASHSRNYEIWQYGSYATKGVKEVCEFGYPRTLEQEMRRHSQDVRTVVKTPGIWWQDPVGLKQSRWARFSVDARNHLLTMLTMLGPSPDWCVGVSGLDLCLPNCSWAGDMTIDLLPWDAGTDDGVTYMSRNLKSDPQQKITRITHSFPNNPNSPFYGRSPITPLARLTLHRIHPKPGAPTVCHGNESIEIGTDEDDTDFDVGGGSSEFGGLTDMEKKKLMMEQGKCAVTDWGDWSECSVTCGVGQRFRKRMFLNPMVTEDMCQLELMETENCIGVENECETLDDDCAVTAWSDWSPCSVSCGKGIKERKRYYLRKMDMKRCDRVIDERDMCVAEVMDCAKAVSMKNFTAICALDMDVGPCRGRFIRWFYDVTSHKCMEFTYGGCRGNNNRFRSFEECHEMCVEHMRALQDSSHEHRNDQSTEETDLQKDREVDFGEVNINCMVSEWADWSECSATCGKAYKFKRRIIKQDAIGNGKKCPKKLEKKRRCETTKCRDIVVHDSPDYDALLYGNNYERDHQLDEDIVSNQVTQRSSHVVKNCQVTQWTEWSVCSQTCGKHAFQYKRRTITEKPENGGKQCPFKLERKRKCGVPSCPVDCKLGPWGDWSPCGKTCGTDSIQERTRHILQMPRRNGAPCEARLERRYCSLPQCPDQATRKLTKEEHNRRLQDLRSRNL